MGMGHRRWWRALVPVIAIVAGWAPPVAATASAAAVEHVSIVALGDSYIAGNGAGSYFGPSGCYRSHDNFAERWATLLSDDGVAVEYHNGACSGASTDDIAGQIAGARRELAGATHVLVTIGGNNARFGNLVFQCLFQRDRRECQQAVDGAVAMLGEIRSAVAEALADIAAAAPDATVSLVGYPLLVGPNTYDQGSYEAGNAIRTLGALADSALLGAVRTLNHTQPGRYQFVSLVDLYEGHGLRGPESDWIRGIASSLIRDEWVHPNDAGHRATAQLLAGLAGFAEPLRLHQPGDVISVPGASTAHLVTTDGTLRWIPSPADVPCLAAGAQVVERAAVAVVSMPIDTEVWATCQGPVPSGSMRTDLDRDGFQDVVVAASGEGFGTDADVGAITVLPGSPTGAGSSGAAQFHQDSPGIPGRNEAGDAWGADHAAGDFDADGFTDLLVGAPGEGLGSARGAGAVTVLYGSRTGLGAARSTLIHQGTAGVPDSNESADGFGTRVAAGDFDGDGYTDAVVAATGESLGNASATGTITVLYGSPAGLSGVDAALHHQDSAEVPDRNESDDRFGSALAVGDLNGDGFADAAVGAAGEGLGSATDAGAVTVLYGSPTGLRGATQLRQDSAGGAGANEAGDRWGGEALAIGDIDGDGDGDLVVGAGSESLGSRAAVGTVTLVEGGVSGIDGRRSATWHQGTAGVPGANEAGDAWGGALAVADIDGDGYGDVAVGAPGEGVAGRTGTGVVTTLRGTATGISAAGARLWHQGTAGVPGANEADDAWGAAVLLRDTDADGRADLVVGAPFESIASNAATGTVTVLSGAASGLDYSRHFLWHQDRRGVPDTNEPGDGWAGLGG